MSVAAPVTVKAPPTLVLPVDSKVAPLIAPDAVTLVTEILSSKATVNVSPDTDVVMLLPPATVNFSPSFLSVLPVSPAKVIGLLPKPFTVFCKAVIFVSAVLTRVSKPSTNACDALLPKPVLASFTVLSNVPILPSVVVTRVPKPSTDACDALLPKPALASFTILSNVPILLSVAVTRVPKPSTDACDALLPKPVLASFTVFCKAVISTPLTVPVTLRLPVTFKSSVIS